MDVAIFVAIVFIILARRNAVYHPDLLFSKSITIENDKIRRIFIPKRSALYKGENASPENRTKMTVIPFIFGGISVIYLIAIFIRELLAQTAIMQAGFFWDTDAIFNILIFFASMAGLAVATLIINSIKCFGTKTVLQKIGLVVRVILAAACTFGFGFGLYTVFTL